MPGPLEAELSAASLIMLQRQHGMSQQLCDLTITSVLTEDVAEYPCDASAAVVRAIIAVGSQPQRSAATSVLGEITASGFYPPAWGAVIGRPAPIAAWRRYDVFGDTETIAIEFAYGPDRHVLLVRTDLFRPPAAIQITIADNAAAVTASMQDNTDPLSRWEDLDLATARARLEPALTRCDRGRHPNLPKDSLARLPVARARMRRLPRTPAGAPEVAFLADDPAVRCDRVPVIPGSPGRRRSRHRAVLGRGAHRIQQPGPRNTTDPGRPDPALACPARLRPDHGGTHPGTAPRDARRGQRLGEMGRRHPGTRRCRP
jgi:hypothetical protein